MKKVITYRLVDPSDPTIYIDIKGHLVNEYLLLPANLIKSAAFKTAELAKTYTSLMVKEMEQIEIVAVVDYAIANGLNGYLDGVLIPSTIVVTTTAGPTTTAVTTTAATTTAATTTAATTTAATTTAATTTAATTTAAPTTTP